MLMADMCLGICIADRGKFLLPPEAGELVNYAIAEHIENAGGCAELEEWLIHCCVDLIHEHQPDRPPLHDPICLKEPLDHGF